MAKTYKIEVNRQNGVIISENIPFLQFYDVTFMLYSIK